ELGAKLDALPGDAAGAAPAAVEKIEKARLIAAGSAEAVFPLTRILSLLDSASRELEEAAGRGGPTDDGRAGRADAAERCAEAARLVRGIVAEIGRERAAAIPLAGLDSGGLLPFEREALPQPGRILLALEPAFAARLAELLRRFDHAVDIAETSGDIGTAFGFPEAGRKPTANPPDILIVDLFSCGFAGFELQEKIKTLGGGVGTRVIVVTPFGEPKCAARAIQLGADDCLGWDVEPSVLLARIESSLERRRLKFRRQLYLAALSRARESLEEELRRGAEYVRCLLPGKITGEALSTDWRFIPSASLGGDLFGYHRLPDGRMALFIIDVSGHGVQSALYSVTIFDVLRGAGLKDVDFGDPASVLKGLNHAFRMEERNNMLFTLWYGVWDDRTRALSHASAGSPPAVLVLRGGGAVELKAEGMVGGADSEAEYRRLEIQVPRGSRLFLFSDGIYEFFAAGGEMLGLEAFVQLLERAASSAAPGESSVGAVIGEVSALSSSERFQDDLSLLEVRFD
ncbi:fused response regulator/phosphatase, partial [bacterium]|nr:fused response regulator/phosphatase [bacterium]